MTNKIFEFTGNGYEGIARCTICDKKMSMARHPYDGEPCYVCRDRSCSDYDEYYSAKDYPKSDW